MIRIAVLSTCFNRKETTIRGISRLYEVLDRYNAKTEDEDKKIAIRVFITDDGADGTAEAVVESFPNKNILTKKGTGYLYWSRGIRLVWLEALKEDYDFYFMLNDDVYLLDNIFDELLFTHNYAIEKYRMAGVYEGSCKSSTDPVKTTYGGYVLKNKYRKGHIRLDPSGIPQLIHLTNGNILIVHDSVVKKIGILYKGYIHSADLDYGLTAKEKDLPVLLMPNYCGICNDDHKNFLDIYVQLNFKERRKALSRKGTPCFMKHDQLLYVLRHCWYYYPLKWLWIYFGLFFPKKYVKIIRTK